MPTPNSAESVSRKFWRKVEKQDGDAACWIFRGCIHPHGYGKFWNGERHVRAHRFAFTDAGRSIGEGLVLDHLCRVRACVRPDHLEAVTQRENLLRGSGSIAMRAAQTHCLRGHEFTPENTIRSGSQRRCRTCRRVRSRAVAS